MTKSVFAISNHGSMLGGGEHSFLDLLSHLPQDWQPLAALPEQGELALRLAESGIRTCIIPLPSLRPWFTVKILASLRSCYNTCKADQPNLIYANGSRAALYGGIVGRILGIPMIWHCRIAHRDLYLDRVLTRLAMCIIANSHATADRFSSGLNNKIKVVYNGVDIQWLREESGQRPNILQRNEMAILVIARVSRRKRHDIALSALEKVARQVPHSHLFCLGEKDPLDPEWWHHLQDKTAQSPFFDRIHWVGQVKDLRPWLRSASLLLLPSENESFGRVLVEAMACGVPVIATRSGGVPEIVRHGQDGFLVKPGRSDEMAAAALKILRDDFLREKLASSARKRAEVFSLHSHVKEMVRIFDDVTGQRNRL